MSQIIAVSIEDIQYIYFFPHKRYLFHIQHTNTNNIKLHLDHFATIHKNILL